MGRNKPSGDAAQISMGPGIIFLGPVGATPSVDGGHVTGDAALSVIRERTDIRAGSPQNLIEALASQEDVSIEFTGIEWDMDALAKALGDGTTAVSGADETLKVGGAPDFNKYALRFQHIMADGGTLTADMWKVIPAGEVAIALNLDSPHEMPMKFDAMYPGATDWGAAALSAGEELVKLSRIKP